MGKEGLWDDKYLSQWINMDKILVAIIIFNMMMINWNPYNDISMTQTIPISIKLILKFTMNLLQLTNYLPTLKCSFVLRLPEKSGHLHIIYYSNIKSYFFSQIQEHFVLRMMGMRIHVTELSCSNQLFVLLIGIW